MSPLSDLFLLCLAQVLFGSFFLSFPLPHFENQPPPRYAAIRTLFKVYASVAGARGKIYRQFMAPVSRCTGIRFIGANPPEGKQR